MSQFAGEDTISVYGMITDGRLYMPKEENVEKEEKHSLSKKVKIIIACGVAMVIVIGLMLQANSLNIALFFKGVDVDTVSQTVQGSYALSGANYAILHGNTKDGAPALIRGVENAFGFWRIDELAVITDEQPVVSMAWSESGGVWLRDTGEEALYDRACWHVLYKGSNACADIAFKEGQLPDDCTLSVSQNGEDYILRIASFSGDLSRWPVMEYLQQNGCIKDN